MATERGDLAAAAARGALAELPHPGPRCSRCEPASGGLARPVRRSSGWSRPPSRCGPAAPATCCRGSRPPTRCRSRRRGCCRWCCSGSSGRRGRWPRPTRLSTGCWPRWPDLRAAAALLALGLVVTAALYPVPVWSVVAALLVAAAGFVGWWLARPGAAPLALAAGFAVAGLAVSLHADVLTAVAVSVGLLLTTTVQPGPATASSPRWPARCPVPRSRGRSRCGARSPTSSPGGSR